MIGRWSSRTVEEEQVEPKGFDSFELRLGDLMRGERATMGKSLLDVQRELRIKASYIAAIENADPDAFDTPGFIAGYVRSYARYLNMDPDKAFDKFCTESGFSVAHGMSAEASVIKKPNAETRNRRPMGDEIFVSPSMPFTPAGEGVLSRVEPGAIGSMLVLVALIGGIGFGGWTVLQEVQRVQVAPVDQTPVVLSDLDPLDGALATAPVANRDSAAPLVQDTPRAEALDRLYRPQALDVPVLTARDAPIASIDPRAYGNFTTPTLAAATLPSVDESSQFARLGNDAVPQVVETVTPGVKMIAAYDSWVQVKASDGTTIFETIMTKGDVFDIPATEEPPILRTGESGALYFAMAGECFGPVGARGSITKNLPLQEQALAELYVPVDPNEDRSLTRMFAELASEASSDQQNAARDLALLAALPCKTE